jgi:hypothetical protein
MAFDLPAAVNSFAAQLVSMAQDEHEAALLLRGAHLLLQMKWQEALNTAEELKAGLVLAQRAQASGKSVEDQKLELAALLQKKVGEPVTALEVLTVATSTVDLDPKALPVGAPVKTP